MAILSTAEILNLIHKETGRFPAFPFPCHWKLNIPYTEDELTEKKAILSNFGIPILFNYISNPDVQYDYEGSPLLLVIDHRPLKSFLTKQKSIPIIKIENEWIVTQDIKLKKSMNLTLVVQWDKQKFADHGLNPESADIEKEMSYFFEIARDHLTQLIYFGGQSQHILRKCIHLRVPKNDEAKRGRVYYVIDLGYGWKAYGDLRDKANMLSSGCQLQQKVIDILTISLPPIGV